MKLNKFLKIHKTSLSFLLIFIIFSTSFLVVVGSYNFGSVAIDTLDFVEAEEVIDDEVIFIIEETFEMGTDGEPNGTSPPFPLPILY